MRTRRVEIEASSASTFCLPYCLWDTVCVFFPQIAEVIALFLTRQLHRSR